MMSSNKEQEDLDKAKEEIFDYAKYVIGMYANIYPENTEGLFWKARLKKKLVFDWNNSDENMPGAMKMKIGTKRANVFYKGSVEIILSDDKLFNQVKDFYYFDAQPYKNKRR